MRVHGGREGGRGPIGEEQKVKRGVRCGKKLGWETHSTELEGQLRGGARTV